MEDRKPIYMWIAKGKAKTTLPFCAACRFPQNKHLMLHYIMYFGWKKEGKRANTNPSLKSS